MEIEKYLGKIIFDFEKANRLSEDQHKRAFVTAFKAVFTMIADLFADSLCIELKSRWKIDSEIMREVSQRKKEQNYEIPTSQFFDSLAAIAEQIYYSQNMEVTIVCNSKTPWIMIAAMDPIYFSLQPMKKKIGRNNQ